MPVSDMTSITPIMVEISKLWPAGVLECGIGFGKYGALCREMLDVGHGRVTEGQWTVPIVGIEGFEQYRNPLWEVYSKVVIGDFTTMADFIKDWPLVLMIDSLEHLERSQAEEFLDHVVQNNWQVIVSVPVGVCPQGAVHGNEFERHRSVWNSPEDFSRYSFTTLHRGVCMAVSIKGAKKL